jgi:pimeloyl-ACP methyl ester carboxylesterase
MTLMQVVVDNLLTTYEKTGKGPLVLLIHGWGDSQVTFKQLVQSLRKDHTVVTLDLPGFGQSEIPHEVWTLDIYARFVQKFLAKIEASPQTIIAHSNGGAVAIRGLSLGALQADKLVLLASAGIRDRQSFRRFFLKIIAKTGKVLTFWLPRHHKKTLQKRLYGTVGSDMLAVPHLQETFKITVRQDIQKDAKHLRLPTLLIYGEGDKATPPLYGELFKKLIPNSRLEIIPKAEHFVHHDQPEQVDELIKGFLK